MAKRWRASAIRALTSFGAVPPKLVRAAAELAADKRPTISGLICGSISCNSSRLISSSPRPFEAAAATIAPLERCASRNGIPSRRTI